MSQATPTRIAPDIVAAAKRVGAEEHRSQAEQINYWVRIGMALERQVSSTSRAVLAVVTGQKPFSSLTNDADRRAAHALDDASIATRAAAARPGANPQRDSAPFADVDEDGNLITVTPS